MRDGHLNLASLPAHDSSVEMVERKGIGHPDTICDALAENLSRNLCRYYREHFGEVFHHNVDKALLCAGLSRPQFGGGQVDIPMDIILAGRATGSIGGKSVPVEEIAIDGSRQWLRDNLHALNVDKHVRIHSRIRHGSAQLTDLFEAGRAGVALANDTSFGVGYAPLSPLESLVRKLDLERTPSPAWGEDTKVMAVHRAGKTQITVACAIIDSLVANADEYVETTDLLRRELLATAGRFGIDDVAMAVNAGDDVKAGRFYLTVTGTSAESGDDGQVGRGNRANGLITPYRPMSLEALAGKNPVNHVGKLYNVTASRIARSLVADLDDVDAANCVLVSRIGQPVTEPMIADVRLGMATGRPVQTMREAVKTVVENHLQELPAISDRFIAGEFELY